MTTQLTPLPVFRAWDNNGVPLAGGLLFTYIAGSTTKQATFTDSTGGVQNPNPVVLNYRGEAQVWLDPTKVYKFVLAPSTDTDPPTNPFWSVDQINGGSASPSFNIIPTVDNLFTLGSTTFSWANVYVGPNHAPILGASGIVGYYPRTAAEIALLVTPTDFSYPADPCVDPRRYGADATGVVDSTTAVQTALNVAYQAGGAVFISGKFLTGALSLTMSGAATKPLRIFGSTAIGSALLAKAGLSATSLLTFTTANPNTTLIEAFLVIENIQILSPVITVGVQGLSLFGIAKWTLRNVRIARFDVGLDIQNTENHTADCCEFVANRTGVRVALLGAFFIGMPTPTLQRFNNCVMNLNTFRGVDYNSGTGLYLIECGIEGNGIAADVTTGGVFIGNACSPDLQEGHVVIQNCWLENNKGWTINQAAQVNGNLQRIAIKSCEIIGAESGRAVLISGSWIVEMSDLLVNSAGDTFNITCQYGHLSNITVNILTATGIVWPFFSNIQTAAGFQYFGRVDTWVATLTGCTTAPTANVTTIQQGDQVTFILPDLTAVSNTTSCTLTGIPAKYQPTAGLHFLPAIIENNTIDATQQVLLQVGNNAITLYQGGSLTGFTAAGNKGTRRGDIIFRLAA